MKKIKFNIKKGKKGVQTLNYKKKKVQPPK